MTILDVLVHKYIDDLNAFIPLDDVLLKKHISLRPNFNSSSFNRFDDGKKDLYFFRINYNLFSLILLFHLYYLSFLFLRFISFNLFAFKGSNSIILSLSLLLSFISLNTLLE